MAENIDSLQIEISANTAIAEKSLERLAASLIKLRNSLGGISNGQFQDLSSGVKQLSEAMQRFTGSTKTADFTRIATGLNKLSLVNVQGVSDASRAINTLTANLSQIGTIKFDAQGIANIANGIAQLGRKTVTQATTNIPLLTQSLKSLVTGLNQIGSVTFDSTSLSQLVSAITKMGGKSATTAASGNIAKLATELRNMMSTLSKSPKVSSNIIQMTQALAQLASTGGRAGTATRSLSTAFNGFAVSSKKASTSAGGLAAAFGKFYATYWLLLRGLGQFKKAIDISSDLTEVQNVVDVTFGNMSDTMNEFADSALQNYGMSELMAKQIASRFQAMGVSMGFAQSKMTEMSIELTKLAGDMASFYNVSQQEIATGLQSIFTGETEPLRRFGLDLSFATVEAWALSQGLDADMQSMTQAEKTMLRYQFVLANTGAAQGDFLRTMNSWHNQLVLLAGGFQQLGSIVGGVLINAFKPFIQALNSVMGAVINFAQVVSDALGAIFGWEYQVGGGVANDMENAAGAAEDIEDATGGAADNAKKLNKYIAAWHEVNNMTSNEGSKGSGGGGGGAGTGSGTADGGQWVQAESIWEKYTSSIDSLYGLGEYISKVLTQTMNDIDWDSIYQSASNFGSGLASFLNGLISPELFGALGTTIGGALNTALYGLNSFGVTFDWTDFGESIAAGINNFFSTFDFALLANTIDVWVQGIWTTITTALTKIEWSTVFDGIKDFLSHIDLETVAIIIEALTIKKIGKVILSAGILKNLKKVIGKKISSAIIKGISFAGIGKFLAKAFPSNAIIQTITTKMETTGASLPKVLLSLIGAPIKTFFVKTVPGLIASAIGSIGTVLGTVGSAIGLTGAGAVAAGGAMIIAALAATINNFIIAFKVITNLDEIKTFFVETIPTVWNETVLPFFQSIPDKLSEIWENVKILALEKWGQLVDFMSTLPETIGNIITNVANWFTELSGKIGYALGYALGTITAWAVNVYDYLKEQIPETIEAIRAWWGELPDKIGNAIAGTIEKIQTWAYNVHSTFQAKIQETIEAIRKWWSEAPDKIYQEIIKIKSKIEDWGTNTISYFRTEVPKIVDKVIEFFGQLKVKIVTVGEDLIKGLWDGINNMVDWLGTNISGFVTGVIDGFKEGFDEHSPSKVAFEIGDFFTLGLANGIKDRFGDIYRDIDTFADNIADTRFEMPVLDLSVDTSQFKYQPVKIDIAKATGQIREAIDYTFASGGIIDYKRLGQAVYQAQTQAMKENPLKIGDRDIFDANVRETRRFGARTHKNPYPIY